MAAEDPVLSEHEQVVVRALHRAASTERAPAQLRERIELERSRASSRSRSGFGVPALGSLGSRAWSGAVAVVAVAVVAVVLLLTGGMTSGTPSVASAAALAMKGAAASAPSADPTARYRLAASVGDLHFPNWEADQTGWNAVGSRMDRLGNRDVKTVFYQRGGQRIAYSIVSTPRIRSGHARTFMSGGRTVFVWTESGHTCLLSGTNVSAATLRNLVATTRAETGIG
jgi:hypothetical protein